MHRRAVLGGIIAAPFISRRAFAASDKVRYILPTVPDLPTAAIWILAKHLGYYNDEGIDVEFLIGKGGVDGATQVGAGNGDFAGGIGDTPMIVRANGVPARGVMLVGDGALMVLAARKDAQIKSPKDLKGKTVAVYSFQDTTYYSLLGMLETAGLSKSDVNIQALGPAGMTQALVTGSAQAMAGIPDLAVAAEMAGVEVDIFAAKDYTISMAQATLASDRIIKDNPDLVKRFLKATMRSFNEFRTNTPQMTKSYIEAVPSHHGEEARLTRIFELYKQVAWGNPAHPGCFDAEKMKKLQDFYTRAGIIRRATPVDELFTNDFVA